MFTAFVVLQLVSAGIYSPDPFFTFSSPYRQCDRIVTPVSRAIGSPSGIIPIQRGPEAPEDFTIDGSIVITSGCGFAVQGFSFTGANESYWFGSYQESELNRGMILSATPIAGPGIANLSATPSNAEFEFINNEGREVSYYGFNQFRIYTKDTNAFIAFGNIPLSVTTTRYVPGPFDNNIAPGTAVAVSSASISGFAPASIFAAFISLLSLYM